MDSSDSLKLDEHLARFLAAFDQGIEGGDEHATTVHVPMPPEVSDSPPPRERQVTPLTERAANEGSLGEVMPDSGLTPRPFNGLTPPPQGGPHRVGRFELRRQLGKGGCGIVFLAYDPKLQREVALKIPRPEMLLNQDAKRRLINEAKAAAEFDHPNLVPVYETGEIGPLCFIATAFCPGQTLAEWLDRQAFPVPVRQAARLIATVAEAVQHAHDRAVLHRDLKPNNVILQEMKVEENDEPPPGSVQLRGDYFVPRVVDFGLAKLLERGGQDHTATRQILGTPKYMSPEQAQARREDIGPTADVYALGVVLYEMLAGRAPYDGATDVEVLRQSVEGRPVPPRHLRPDVPRDLEAICLKAMARTTAARYRTAIDLADDLRRFLDGHPTIARPLKWHGRAARWLRRNDRVVAIIVLLTIALVLTGVATWTGYRSQQFRTARDQLNDQAEARARADQQREYARRVREAFLAWRAGDMRAASELLESARRATPMPMEAPDFTHDYLVRMLKSGQLTIVCPAGSVTALAVSADGTRIASGHADGTLALWDRATGDQLGSAQAHAKDITHVGFALNGTLLITSGRTSDGTAEMLGWRVTAAGTVERAPEQHLLQEKDITCFTVSSDSKVIYAGGHNGLLQVIHLNDPRRNIKVHAHRESITAIAVSPDGKWILTGNAEGTVQRRWTVNMTVVAGSDYRSGARVSALVIPEDGLPLIGFADGGIVSAVGIGDPMRRSTGQRVHWIAYSRAGGVATNLVPGRVFVGGWKDLATGDTGTVLAGVFTPDGKILITGSEDGVLRSWNVGSDIRERAAISVGRVTAIGVHGEGGHIDAGEFVVATEQHLTAFDTRAPGFDWTRHIDLGPRRQAHVVQMLDDGPTRAVMFDGNAALVCEITRTAKEILRVAMPGGRAPTSAALTRDGSRLAVGDDAGRVTVWSIADRTVLATFDTTLGRAVPRVALSSDGRLVAAPIAKGIGIWTIGETAEVTIPTDDQAVFRFVPVGDRLITGSRGGVVKVWTITGREELVLHGHVGRVTGLGISPDGRTLVSGGATGEVKFWDLRTGQELLGLRRHSSAVTVIEFAANGKLLVTGGEGQVAVWDARSE